MTETPLTLTDMMAELTRAGLIRHSAASRRLPPLEAYLRAWQSRRLATTYADLLASPEYGAASRFFLTDVSAPLDFSRRDADVARMLKAMGKVLPPERTRSVTAAIELNELSKVLDAQLLHVMRTELGLRATFTSTQYAEAYRLCDNYQQRVRQINLVVENGHHLYAEHHLPFARQALQAAKLPAQLFGWGELYDFLERGFRAWNAVQDVASFLQTIESRERAFLNRIYQENGSG